VTPGDAGHTVPDVFISYSRRDLDFVRKLCGALVARGKDAWVDWEDIPPTAEWLEEVFQAIESSDNFLFVITPDSLTSEVCARELAHALERRKRLVPVLRRPADGRPVPEALAARNWTFVREEDDFAASVETLVTALDTDLDWVRAHTRLLGRALEWEKRGADASLLLRGRDLDDAERWVASQSADREPLPTPLQMEYVLASRRTTTRRQRLLVGAALVAVVVASTLAALAWWQRNEAVEQRRVAELNERLALSRERAAEARAAVDVDPRSALTLAVSALATARTNEAADSLRAALRAPLPSSLVRVGDTRVWDAELSADGARLITASEDGRARIWNRATGRLLASIKVGVELSSARLTPDERFLLTAPRNGETGSRLWRAAGGAQTPIATFGRQVFAAALSPDGRLVATAGADGVQVWSRSGRGRAGRLLRLPSTAEPPRTVEFSDDGSTIAAASPTVAAVWAVVSDRRLAVIEPLAVMEPPEGVEIRDVGLSPNGRRLVTADDDGVARIWRVSSPDRAPVQLTGHSGILRSAGFSTDGHRVLTAGNDTTARLWDVEKRKPRLVAELLGHGGSVAATSFGRDDRVLVTAGLDGTVRLWPSPETRLVELRKQNTATVRDVRFSRDGRLLVTAGDDGSARVWKLGTASPPLELHHGRPHEDDWVNSASFDRVARHVVTAGVDGTVQVWSTTSRSRPLATLGSPGGTSVRAAEFSPDGALVAAGDADGVVHLWRWASDMRARDLDGPSELVDDVAFSPSGRLVAGASWDGKVWLWKIMGGDGRGTPLRGRLEREEKLTSVAFSPDGSRVAAGSSLGSVVVWDVQTRERLARFRSSGDDYVTSVGFSADGRLLVASDDGGVARIVGAARGQRVAELRTSAEHLEAAAFSPRPGDWRVAVAGTGGVAALVDCTTCPPVDELVCLAIPRVATEARVEARAAFPGCRTDD
jgi:WD40 repeat protein